MASFWRRTIPHSLKRCRSITACTRSIKPQHSQPPQQQATTCRSFSTMPDLSTSPTSILSPFLARTVQQEKKGNTNENCWISSLEEMVQELPAALTKRTLMNITPGAPEDPVCHLFRRTKLTRHDWNAYAFLDPTKPYTRNLIATDHQTFTLLLLCWNPQQESPIHDHPCDGCWMQVMEGSIREQRYNRNVECVQDAMYAAPQLTYITDSMGYHKVGNPTQDQPAVTLHLYAPPFYECTVWCESNKSPPQRATSCNHSEYGHVVVTAPSPR